jgi:hypothetical protein
MKKYLRVFWKNNLDILQFEDVSFDYIYSLYPSNNYKQMDDFVKYKVILGEAHNYMSRGFMMCSPYITLVRPIQISEVEY